MLPAVIQRVLPLSGLALVAAIGTAVFVHARAKPDAPAVVVRPTGCPAALHPMTVHPMTVQPMTVHPAALHPKLRPAIANRYTISRRQVNEWLADPLPLA